MNISDPTKAYRQSAIQTESMADVFIQLYDQLASVLYSAALAVEARDIQKKTADVGRALTILIHLQGALDFEHGGEVAANLNQFYKLVRRKVSEGSVKLDAGLLRQAAAHVVELRNLWDQAQALTLQQQAATPSVSASSSVQTNRPHADSSFSVPETQNDVPQSRGWSA
jgi:flagellar secretion chaperone FliS